MPPIPLPDDALIIKRLHAACRAAGLIFIVVGLVACATTAPVQEMSDARQAVHAARDARAHMHEPALLEAAELFLEQASEALAAGDYDQARTHALAAKRAAIDARTGAGDLQ